MIDYPKRPEGTVSEQIAALWEYLWKLVEQINLAQHEQDAKTQSKRQ